MTDAQFDAAVKAVLYGPDSKWPIGPQMVVAARAKLAAEEKVIDSMLGRNK